MERKHIFAINRSEDFLELVRTLLQDERYHVTTTNSPPRTFDQVVAAQPDVLLLDLSVSADDWDLFVRLEEEIATRDIPMVVTGTDWELLDRARAEAHHGRHRFLAMPLDIDDLLAAVDDLVGPA